MNKIVEYFTPYMSINQNSMRTERDLIADELQFYLDAHSQCCPRVPCLLAASANSQSIRSDAWLFPHTS